MNFKFLILAFLFPILALRYLFLLIPLSLGVYPVLIGFPIIVLSEVVLIVKAKMEFENYVKRNELVLNRIVPRLIYFSVLCLNVISTVIWTLKSSQPFHLVGTQILFGVDIIIPHSLGFAYLIGLVSSMVLFKLKPNEESLLVYLSTTSFVIVLTY